MRHTACWSGDRAVRAARLSQPGRESGTQSPAGGRKFLNFLTQRNCDLSIMLASAGASER